MIKIGIIGGVGPQATKYLYEKVINYAIKNGAVNNDDYPYLNIISLPIPDFISDKKMLSIAREMLRFEVQNLVKSNCSEIYLASNTVHIIFNELNEISNNSMISFIDLVVDEAVNQNYQKVGLVGTPTTIQSMMYQNNLERKNIEIIIPTNDELHTIENIIRLVISGKANPYLKREYKKVLERIYLEGAESIILGCTELPLVLNYKSYGKGIINSLDVLARSIINMCYFQE